MRYKFHAYGHPNILGTHKTTLEFTKDRELSLNGDCIIGVKADFELGKLKQIINNNKKVKITIMAVSKKQKIKDVIFAEPNLDFRSSKELVIRKTDFVSGRTFAVNSDKGASDLDRRLAAFLKAKNKIRVVIEN